MQEEDTISQAGLRGFQSRKEHCLGKRDKSSAGRIDPRAVEICSAANDRPEYYTTSSCAGRCFMYRGDGIKSHHHFVKTSDDNTDTDNTDTSSSPSGHGYFARFRVSHDIIRDGKRFFDLSTLNSNNKESYDGSGGGDPVRSIGQYDHKQLHNDNEQQQQQQTQPFKEDKGEGAIWLRFEPFILHVMCRTLAAASALMKAARPSFKNVGLTSWKHGYGRYIVAIWGDEGLDLPLTPPETTVQNQQDLFLYKGREQWLTDLINERHYRNWNKIDRFVKGFRSMPAVVDDVNNSTFEKNNDDWTPMMTTESESSPSKTTNAPKRYDVVGDVALLHTLPPGTDQEREAIGKTIMERNKAIKVVAAQSKALSGTERSPGNDGLVIIAGRQRLPLITSHREYGIDCVVDLNNTFFSSRMGPERLRICQQIARGERVLVLFSGVGMDALQIVARTEASSVIAVELNPTAAECARRGKQLLVRNKKAGPGAHDRLRIIEGDVLDIIPILEPNSFDRIVAPRPKEGKMDGDLGTGDGGLVFLEAMLPLMKEQGECHWYDFAADHEFPECTRTQGTIMKACQKLGYEMEVINVAHVGSIAKRQLRVCMDFRIISK